MKKSKLLATLAGGSVLASQAGLIAPVYAASRPAYYATHIYAGSSLVSSPDHIDAMDSGNLTAFLPLYYVSQALGKFGVTGAWYGNDWNLTTPKGMNVDMSNPQSGQQTNAGTLSMDINGQIVQYAPRQVAGDPANGGQATTFLPIWYIDQVLNRLSISATWDGTSWRLTKTTPEMQQAMATDMWNTFANVNWAINAHPSMADAGVNPSASTPMTAADIATWLADWAAKAKGTIPYFGPMQGKWVPYSLQYEVSTDPYTWASVNGLFQGTSVTNGSSVVSSADADTILSNLQWWLTGDKVTNEIHHLHVPFYSNYLLWYGQGVGIANYQNVLTEVTRTFDNITAVVNGTTINLNLPNTTTTQNKLGYWVVDGYWTYGGWQVKDNRGGKVIQVPESKMGGLLVALETLIPNYNLEGYSVTYKNSDTGIPTFTQPVSELASQSQAGN